MPVTVKTALIYDVNPYSLVQCYQRSNIIDGRHSPKDSNLLEDFHIMHLLALLRLLTKLIKEFINKS
jgi:hypothetical protein